MFYAGIIDGRDILFLHGNSNQEHEVVLGLRGIPRLHHRHSPLITHTRISTIKGTIISFLPGIKGLVTVWDSDTQLILYSDTETAATFWSPVIASKTTDPLKNYWGLGTNDSILVGGPYLVRSAEISGSNLALRGDLKTDVRLTVIAPRSVGSITWNGQRVSVDVAASSGLTPSGGFVGQLSARKASASSTGTGISVPKLEGWRFHDSLPEIRRGFDDVGWVTANKTTTNIPSKPYYGDGRVLYGCDYGLCVGFDGLLRRWSNLLVFSCENVVLWRGHFEATGAERSVNLSINGGQGRAMLFFTILSCLILLDELAFAASVWLNDVFLGTSFGK